MKQISILGCGWLGLPLAKSLLQNGYRVLGSTTSEEKMAVLEKVGISPFLVCLSEHTIKGEIDSFLNNSEILIIDIPPKLRRDSSENFVIKIQNLIPFIEKSQVNKLLFVSSTSVYSDTNSTITEETIPNPDTESGKQLLEVEQLLQSNSNFQTIVIRFGGLIGEDRHPIKFLAGRIHIENPLAPINLIHQIDCIGIIEAILQQDSKGNETYNAAAPFHPNRKEYYTQKAIEFNLPLPQFNESKPSIGKLISITKVEQHLGYSFSENRL
ncbi:SDR family oxidoreductase [Flavobacterium sp.]|uniref:SDR family oxidoreductase n=1 Tax=Flavobacterium sp. TaxID=239 RepID=UPI003BE52FCB